MHEHEAYMTMLRICHVHFCIYIKGKVIGHVSPSGFSEYVFLYGIAP